MLGVGVAISPGQVRAVEAGGPPSPVPDDLDTALAALEAAGKLVCAWFLPLNDPDQYLTLNSGAVEGWAAAYGSQKVDLSQTGSARPQWDATLFGDKGGIVFDGTDDCLEGTGNVTNWPDNTADLYMLAATRQDQAAGTGSIRYSFTYGTSLTNSRSIGRTALTSPDRSRAYLVAGSTVFFAAGAGDFDGPHTVGGFFDIGGTTALHLDGVSVGTAASATAALTRTRVRIGANANSTPGNLWLGAIVAAAILNSTASGTDFTDLEALMRARLS